MLLALIVLVVGAGALVPGPVLRTSTTKMSLLANPEVARGLAAGAAGLVRNALPSHRNARRRRWRPWRWACPWPSAPSRAARSSRPRSRRRATTRSKPSLTANASARNERTNGLCETPRRGRVEELSSSQADDAKKREAKAKLAERIAAAKAEELRIQQNQAAVLKAEQEKVAAKAAAMAAAKRESSAQRAEQEKTLAKAAAVAAAKHETATKGEADQQ